MVGYLPKEKTGRLAKIILYFLWACDTKTCSLEVTGKIFNQGDGKRKEDDLQVIFFTSGYFY